MKMINLQTFNGGLIESAFRRMRDTVLRKPIVWVQVCRLILAVWIALSLSYALGLSGGVITVVAVLFLPAIPHSLNLVALRVVTAIIGFGGGWMIAYEFVEQPWLLVAVLSVNATVWFYFAARGMLFLSMMMLGLMPFLVGWMVYAGKPAEAVSDALVEYLCGLAGAEFIALVWPITGVTKLRGQIGAALRDVENNLEVVVVGQSTHKARHDRQAIGPDGWTAARSLGFNASIAQARAERGDVDHEIKQLLAIAEQTRSIIALPAVYRSFVVGKHIDDWMFELEDERLDVRCVLYPALESIANGVERHEPVPHNEDFPRMSEKLREGTLDWIHARVQCNQISVQSGAFVLARNHLVAVQNQKVEAIECLTRGEEVAVGIGEADQPFSVFSSGAKRIDPAAMLFALKATLCIVIGFTIACIFPNWPGSLILVLLSGFLAPLTVGGLTANFVDRILGLAMSMLVALLVILMFMPNVSDFGWFLVVLTLATLPGVILAQRPATGAIGLSYAMAILFILTTSRYPSVSLDPLQYRLASVAGATLICYIVFRVVAPTSATDAMSKKMANALRAISESLNVHVDTDDPRGSESERLSAFHNAIRRIGDFDQVIVDLSWESSDLNRFGWIKRQLLEDLHATLLLAEGLSATREARLLAAGDTVSRELSVCLDYALVCLIELLNAMTHQCGAVDSDKQDFDVLMRDSERALRDAHDQIAQAGCLTRITRGTPEGDPDEAALVEFAYCRALYSVLRRVSRTLALHNQFQRSQKPLSVGRTA